MAEVGSQGSKGSSAVLGKGQMLSVSGPALRPREPQSSPSEGGFAGNEVHRGVVSRQRKGAGWLRLPGRRYSVCVYIALVISRELVVFI